MDGVTHLSVTEEEHHLLVVQTCLQKDILHIVSPLLNAIVLGQLNLEAVVVCPERESDHTTLTTCAHVTTYEVVLSYPYQNLHRIPLITESIGFP